MATIYGDFVGGLVETLYGEFLQFEGSLGWEVVGALNLSNEDRREYYPKRNREKQKRERRKKVDQVGPGSF